MLNKERLQTIRELIAKGQLNDALNDLVTLTSKEAMNEYNDLILLSAKYKALEKLELDNRISFENYQKGTHQLLRSLITLVDDLEKPLSSTVAIPDANSSLTEIYKTSIARTKVIEVLLAAEKGLTIKEIYQQTGLINRKYIVGVLVELIEGEIVDRYKKGGLSLNRLRDEQRGLVERWI